MKKYTIRLYSFEGTTETHRDLTVEQFNLINDITKDLNVGDNDVSGMYNMYSADISIMSYNERIECDIADIERTSRDAEEQYRNDGRDGWIPKLRQETEDKIRSLREKMLPDE